MKTLLDHARERMHTLPVAVSGQHGHKATFRVACAMVRDFCLGEEEVLMLLREYNEKLQEKWTEKELRHKVKDALKPAAQRRTPCHGGNVYKPRSTSLMTAGAQNRVSWKITPRALPESPIRQVIPPRDETPEVAQDTRTILEANRKADAPNRAAVPATGTPGGMAPLLRDVSIPEVDSSRSAVHPTIVTDAAKLTDTAHLLEGAQESVALDIETYGPGKVAALNPWLGEIRLVSVAVPRHAPIIVDLLSVGYDLTPLAEVLYAREVIIHNGGFDALWLLRKCGLRLPKVFCTMSAARLLHAGDDTQENDLQACVKKFCGKLLPKDQARSDWSQPVLSPEQLTYASNDVLHLHDLKAKLEARLRAEGLNGAFQLEMELLPVVVEMEACGIAVDSVRLQQILAATSELAHRAGERVQRELDVKNPNSPRQLLGALKARGIDIPDTAAETLAESVHHETALILEYRKVEGRRKQARSLLDHVRSDGRIHGRFNPLGADSGRFTSTAPNLQNVGRGELRSVFVAAPGCVLVVADYSQIELRIAAVVADETAMIEAFRSEQDLHRLTAARVLGKDPADITSAERQLAKAVNFGLLFGQSAKGLRQYAKNSYGVEIGEEEALRFRSIFFATYPGLHRWHEQARRAARGDEVCEARTISGRRRWLAGGSENEWDRFTTLVNTPVQGAAADGMKRAMVVLARSLPEGTGIVSTVHDEIIVETPQAAAEEIKELVAQTMIAEMAALFPHVPIEVEAKVCANWGGK